ncbi:flavin-containing monooxygenase [Corynebacterium amycolatum]|uniref:flavin-containing monooxygenase n=1 Tax=Corynebacterium amycolatum TaxID=43765 RepID=UPI000185C369|nr:NAD(P)/FAD-dependent oxidoreductase [Corynebacterium amycolatum]EEB62356.1 hypothetical protein CORAM0001_1857 [Corynebacterium amycolatum SK46]
MDTFDKETNVLIVGGGFSGMATAVALQKEGINDFHIIDRGHDFGGTWRDNSYPGAACDVPSHLYSLSFAQDFDWSRSFGTQPEIYEYQREVARNHGLYSSAHFKTEMVDARWDDDAARWVVVTEDIDSGARTTWAAKELVLGVGALCEPRMPDIQGIETFAGEVFHSSRWNHEVDLRDKRVAIIGTGASAIQIIPKIAPIVGRLDVYQRTAPYVIPRLDRNYTSIERTALRKIPGLRRVVRAQDWFFRELQIPGLTRDSRFMTPIKFLSQGMLRMQVKDPELREKLTPKFTIGCKRMLISNTYFPAIARDNVELVTSPIDRVGPHSITTVDGTERTIDVLIICTGFHVTDSPAFDLVHDGSGQSLATKWQREGMSAYKGATVPGFPNMTMIMGPATGLGHSSMIYMIESQVKYFVEMLKAKKRAGVNVAEVREQAFNKWNDWVRERVKTTVWITGCGSWYRDAHGNAPAVWPSWTWLFRAKTRKFDDGAYVLSR